MHKSWPAVHRVIHFSGGIRGENPPQDSNVYLHPTIPGKEAIIESIENYASIYKLSELYGLILGVDFYQSPDQIHGVYPPEWRVYTYDRGSWLGFSTAQKMAEIINNAYQQGNLEFVDCISKVEAWSKAASRALRGISESYHQILSTRCKDKEYKAPQAFDDMNCDFVNDTMHNFLYYVGTLRDHIAEFIIRYIAHDPPKELNKKPVMSKLKQFLEKGNNDYGLGNIKDAILKGYNLGEHSEILPGWLYMLKEYRNIITHEKPIDMIACRAWTWQLVNESGYYSLPKLKFPIPILPLANTDYFQSAPINLREKLKRVAPSEDFMATNPDGLEVAWRLLIQLLIFLDKVLDKSPIKPEPILLDSSNSWGFRRVE